MCHSSSLIFSSRHQQKTMEVVVWREVSTQRVQRTGSQRTDKQTPCKTPVKRSGSKLSGLGSARKKYKQQCKERKAKGRRDGVADGATVSEKVRIQHRVQRGGGVTAG